MTPARAHTAESNLPLLRHPLTTTEEIACYYEVESSVVRHASKRHRDELLSDGWREVKGREELKTLRDKGCEVFSLPEATTRVAIWTPRAALRLGMVLQDSAVAKAVRTSLLNALEQVIPAQAEEIERLRLQLALAQTQERLMAASQVLGSINPELPVLILRPDVTVMEREVLIETTVVVDQRNRPIARYDGVGISYLAQRYGFGKRKRANDACRQWLRSVGVKEDEWVDELTAHSTRKLPRTMVSWLDKQFATRRGIRQQLIGEGGLG